MDEIANDECSAGRTVPWRFVVLALGIYLTLKGYHSLDGDQAHRLPILLHSLDVRLYADDPFVRSFDAFNPHRGSFQLLGTSARVIGLSATLAGLFALTFALTVRGVHRLASTLWPSLPGAGWAAVVMLLAAKAGNIGTNHLFEAMLLDRLMALALAWTAAAAIVADPGRGWAGSAVALGLAAWIHPSLGLQLAMVFCGSWFAWALLNGTGITWRQSLRAVAATGLAIVPGLAINLAPFGNLREGLSPETFRLLTAELQSPQHMLPHLWRRPQWLAAAAYLGLVLATMLGKSEATAETEDAGPARRRFAAMLGVVLAWLAASWVAVEPLQHVGATAFQPFRIATFGRGLCLVVASGHVVVLWRRGGLTDRLRALLVPVACTGDWLFATVAAVEVATTLIDRFGDRIGTRGRDLAWLLMLAWACAFMAKHDTERGHRVIAEAVGAGVVLLAALPRLRTFADRPGRSGRRFRFAMAAAWALPTAALVAGLIPADHPAALSRLARGLTSRCRFTPRPIEDDEALGAWCRDHTPESARFVGPPGPKGLRLWSRRSWAFNRAGSPYHAEGLRDWYERFRAHVDFEGTPEEFVRAYLDGRHRLEARYDDLSGDRLADLAQRQGAEYVVARADRPDGTASGPLVRLHAEGEFAVYRVRPERLAQAQR